MVDTKTRASDPIDAVFSAAREFVKRRAEEASWTAETFAESASNTIFAAHDMFDLARRATDSDIAALHKARQQGQSESPPVYPKGIPVEDYYVHNALKMCPPLRGLECDVRLDALHHLHYYAPDAAERLRAAHLKLHFAQSTLRQYPEPDSAAGFPGLTDDDIRKAARAKGVDVTQKIIEWYRSIAVHVAWDRAVAAAKRHVNSYAADWWRAWARLFMKVYGPRDA